MPRDVFKQRTTAKHIRDLLDGQSELFTEVKKLTVKEEEEVGGRGTAESITASVALGTMQAFILQEVAYPQSPPEVEGLVAEYDEHLGVWFPREAIQLLQTTFLSTACNVDDVVFARFKDGCWFIIGTMRPGVEVVIVTVDGGGPGGAASYCTFTYTLTDLHSNVLAVGISPLSARYPNVEYTPASGFALACYLADEWLLLCVPGEIAVVTVCP